MADGLAIQKADKTVGLSIDNAFRWRYRILALPQTRPAKSISRCREQGLEAVLVGRARC